MVQAFPPVASPERLVAAVMCDMDDAWSGFRYFSARAMSEPCDERRAGDPPTAEQVVSFELLARPALEASLERADKLEAA